MSQKYGVRPVTDSVPFKGDLFFIELPHPTKKGEFILHKVSTSIQDHQKHMDGMHAAGNHDFIERRVKA